MVILRGGVFLLLVPICEKEAGVNKEVIGLADCWEAFSSEEVNFILRKLSLE